MTRNIKKAIASKVDHISELNGRILYHQRHLASKDKIKDVFGSGGDFRGVSIEVLSVPGFRRNANRGIISKTATVEVTLTVAFRDSTGYTGSSNETFDNLLSDLATEFSAQETVTITSGTTVNVGPMESIDSISLVLVEDQLCHEAVFSIECEENQ